MKRGGSPSLILATTRLLAMSTRAIEPSFVSGTQTVEESAAGTPAPLPTLIVATTVAGGAAAPASVPPHNSQDGRGHQYAPNAHPGWIRQTWESSNIETQTSPSTPATTAGF